MKDELLLLPSSEYKHYFVASWASRPQVNNKSCQMTTQLDGKGWSDKKTISKYQKINSEIKFIWQSMTWLWCQKNVKLRDGVYAIEKVKYES